MMFFYRGEENFGPKPPNGFSRILSVYSGLFSRSVRVEHFSYVPDPYLYPTRAENCYPTRPNRGGFLDCRMQCYVRQWSTSMVEIINML